uniref:Uncharacterized protein n=1 Tax=Trichuris muris TaxID=70415 RepID=A0A5S6QYZ2_TRIMR
MFPNSLKPCAGVIASPEAFYRMGDEQLKRLVYIAVQVGRRTVTTLREYTCAVPPDAAYCDRLVERYFPEEKEARMATAEMMAPMEMPVDLPSAFSHDVLRRQVHTKESRLVIAAQIRKELPVLIHRSRNSGVSHRQAGPALGAYQLALTDIDACGDRLEAYIRGNRSHPGCVHFSVLELGYSTQEVGVLADPQISQVKEDEETQALETEVPPMAKMGLGARADKGHTADTGLSGAMEN